MPEPETDTASSWEDRLVGGEVVGSFVGSFVGARSLVSVSQLEVPGRGGGVWCSGMNGVQSTKKKISPEGGRARSGVESGRLPGPPPAAVRSLSKGGQVSESQ